MVSIKTFQETDIETILPRLRPIFRKELENQKLEVRPGTNALSLWNGSTLIAVVGGHAISLGVFQVWALISEDTSQVAVSFTRKLRFIIGEFMKHYHRIQMSVRDGFEDECRWAKLLGFQQEGLMRAYGPDKHDCWLFGRVA